MLHLSDSAVTAVSQTAASAVQEGTLLQVIHPNHHYSALWTLGTVPVITWHFLYCSSILFILFQLRQVKFIQVYIIILYIHTVYLFPWQYQRLIFSPCTKSTLYILMLLILCIKLYSMPSSFYISFLPSL